MIRKELSSNSQYKHFEQCSSKVLESILLQYSSSRDGQIENEAALRVAEILQNRAEENGEPCVDIDRKRRFFDQFYAAYLSDPKPLPNYGE